MKSVTRLIVPPSLFAATMQGLENRSEGWRESAAVWAGQIIENDWVAERVIFHHELCDDRGGPLSISLTETAKFHLYQTLAATNQRLIALLHTHPESWVDLSWVDQQNQISSRIGFWSIVVPWYGREPWEPTTMGIHQRQTKGWERLTDDAIGNRIVIGDQNGVL